MILLKNSAAAIAVSVVVMVTVTNAADERSSSLSFVPISTLKAAPERNVTTNRH